MKKVAMKITLLLLVFSFGVGVTLIYTNNKYKVYEEEDAKQVKKNINTISMMLETEAGSGNYEMTTRSEWPTEGYVFNSELSKCENGGELSWDDENKRVLMSGNVSDKCYVYFDVVPSVVYLSDYVKSLYTGSQGDNNLYFHDASLINGAGDNSYRYAGSSSSVNNYICFGSYEATCPEDNLYRIIGVFGDKVKVVKYRDIGSYNTSIYNATSFTGTEAYTALNSTFIGTLGDEWQNMIYLENWISGEISSSILSQTSLKNNTYKIEFLAGSVASPVLIDWYTAKVWYTAESNAAHTLSMKIGTISISELRYAMNSSNWNLSTLDNTSWLYYSKNEAFYLFHSFSSGSGDALGYYMTTDGILYAFNEPSYTSDNTQITTYVRPSFYLTSSVTYVSGDGSQSSPLRIN